MHFAPLTFSITDFTARSPRSVSRPSKTTLYPFPANLMAVAKPIPDVPPVIKTVLLSITIGFLYPVPSNGRQQKGCLRNLRQPDCIRNNVFYFFLPFLAFLSFLAGAAPFLGFTASFKALPALNAGFLEAAILISSPV